MRPGPLTDPAFPPTNAAPRQQYRLAHGKYWSIAREHAWMVVPPVAFLGVFLLLPLARVVFSSFAQPTWTLGNYAKVFDESFYLRSFWYTIEVAFCVTVVCLVIAYPLAYAIANSRGRSQKLMSVLVLLPLWTSVVIRSYAWLILFQRQGPVNSILLALGWIDEPLKILQTSTAVEIGMVHILLPFMILPLVSAMLKVDRTLLRAARVLGARPVKVFTRIYIRLTLPGITAGCALVFITSLGFFITPSLLGGAQQTMAAMMIEQAVSVFLNWPLASALSTVLLAMTVSLYLIYAKLTGGEIGMALK
ncbi:MAG TPA: ABC transporter permease [Acetobacteraceae bacterium]|nr:ABC transporter permease [Acetobacteraceae bacterium]